MARAKSGVKTSKIAYCKCGWHGATWLGPGASSNAWGEYHWHKERCPAWQEKASERSAAAEEAQP